MTTDEMLHHMSEIFQDNSVPPQAPAGQQADRKLRIRKSPWATSQMTMRSTEGRRCPCEHLKNCYAVNKSNLLNF